MSTLRPSIAGRLLRTAGQASRRAVPGTIRFESQTSTAILLTKSDKSQGESSAANHEASTDVQVRHNQPDYGAEVDQASSYVVSPCQNDSC